MSGFVASGLALDPDGAFSLCSIDRRERRLTVGRSKKDVEAENEELWRKLEDVYDSLRDLFDAGDEDGEEEDLEND